MTYVPDEKILKKYAEVFVKYALNKGKGMKKGEVVFLQVPECAKPILKPLLESVYEIGAIPIISYIPEGISRIQFEKASDEQLQFFPDKFLKGKVDQADHFLSIIATDDPKELEGINPKKIMMKQSAYKPYMQWRDEKENAGKFSWTLGLYGTQAMADEAKMSLEEYWQEIIKACYLDEEEPWKKWQEIQAEVDRLKNKLTDMQIQKVHVEAKDTDLWVTLGEKRKWLGGSGANIPSFEVFISPDWRGTNGHIQFTEPLYVYGSLIKEVYLEFKEGIVIKFSASEGEEILKEMIATEGANKVGEFSLTDGRMSKITKFMAETLFDENVGGEQGNTHLALGRAYKDSVDDNPNEVSKEEYERLGFNESVVHTDIVATSKRKVTAVLPDGSEKVIYENGKFLI